jgi:hypothetical protein
MSSPPARPSRPWPAHFWLGLVLTAVSWGLNWGLAGLRTHFLFFPLWLGLILTIDGLVKRRSGCSLLTRSRRDFVRLFFASVAVWWLFEALNLRLVNWIYLGVDQMSRLTYVLASTVAYSTVIPAVFEMAELIGTFRWTERFDDTRPLTVSPALRYRLTLVGLAMLALLLIWPRWFFPLTWISLIFLLDPLAHRLGRPSLLGLLEKGRRRPLVLLALGALACGFFWEMWNIYSYPKWIYDIPVFGFARVFEMPLLGYLGYIPFGLELYPLTHLLLNPPPAVKL